jgi:hypothetical protein
VVACNALLRPLAALLVLATCGLQAAAQPAHAVVSVAFASELGDGPFRAALMRGLRDQLDALQLDLFEDQVGPTRGHRFTSVLRVRSLEERVNAAGQPTIKATLSFSLVDPATGTGWLSRVIRTEYPIVGASPLETVGEASGRRVASAICEVACATTRRVRAPQARHAAPPRRIIKESDW